MNKFFKVLLFTIFSFYFLTASSSAQAALVGGTTTEDPYVNSATNTDNSDASTQGSTNIKSEITKYSVFKNNQNIGPFIQRAIRLALIVGAILTLMYLIWGGLDWITSGGDQKKYEDARNKITSAIVGLAILAVIWTLWLIALNFLGLNNSSLLKIEGGSGGGSSASGSNVSCSNLDLSTSESFAPFGGCDAWASQFAAEHNGRTPTQADYDLFVSVGQSSVQDGQSWTSQDWQNWYNNYCPDHPNDPQCQ